MIIKHNLSSSQYSRQQQGFTLVEVMVAMMIVALALTALMVNIGGLIDNTSYLQKKTIAHWVALNELELERINNRVTNNMLTNEKSGETEMVGRQWYWRIKPIKTANEGFLQLQINVYDDEEMTDSLVSALTLVDRYHKKK